ncbi:MAG TPA: lipase maturation factor family protein, partial [bacterium]|nr:lipase maturation factor family protein [bacterium]
MADRVAKAAAKRGRALISLGTSDAYVMRWVFLRVLALTWMAAFVSLGVQVDGLAGPQGILPAGEWLDAVREAAGRSAFPEVPTLCWWLGTSSATLVGLCAAGALLAGLLAAGVFPGLTSLLLWVVYLSLASACRTFLNFQWDALLLETGLLAILLAPWKLWAPGLAADRPPSRTAVLLLRVLLFKLMFLSGVVKLVSGDPTWRGLTALEYHYWTTCLPTWTGWYAHHLPARLHQVSVLAMLMVEIAVPFLVFAPVRRLRTAAAVVLLALQVGIAATGNYGFFNLLTAALCIIALDDAALLGVLPRRWRGRIRPPETHAWVPPLRQAPALALAA